MGTQKKKYDVYDTEKGCFILKDVSGLIVTEKIGVPKEKISTYDTKGFLFNKRYRIVGKTIVKPKQAPKIIEDVVPIITPELRMTMNEWDRVRKNPKLWRTIDVNVLGEYKGLFR